MPIYQKWSQKVKNSSTEMGDRESPKSCPLKATVLACHFWLQLVRFVISVICMNKKSWVSVTTTPWARQSVSLATTLRARQSGSIATTPGAGQSGSVTTMLQAGQSSSVATTLWAGQSEVQIPLGARNFFLLQNFQTGPGTHSASSLVGTGFFSRGEAARE
jgi:hypothetical protein